MYFHLSIKKLVFRIAYWLLLSAVLGYVVGYVWQAIALMCLFLLAWHYHHLSKLIVWLWQSKAISPPMASGLWGRIYDGLYRQNKQHRDKQKRLSKRIRRFRDGAEALPDAALVLTDDFTIEWGNKKAAKLIGIRWPGDIGQRIDNLIRFPEFSRYLEKGEFSTPCRLPSPINPDKRLELRIMPYGGDQFLFLARDISKIYRLEEMRRDFVANVSHELKTPLTVVRGYVEMAQTTGDFVDPLWQQAFDTIEGQVSRMDRLVEQLLILSRVEVNTEPDAKQKVNMPRLIVQFAEDAKWLNQDKQHTIEIRCEANVAILGIESELKSACMNFISNAIAYTQAGGCIIIGWQMTGDKVRFYVKDNGPGIKPADLNRLTERFYRVDKSRSRDTGGSGLGLAIVKHVVNHHNAQLVINSKVDEGSEFSIVFDAEAIVDSALLDINE